VTRVLGFGVLCACTALALAGGCVAGSRGASSTGGNTSSGSSSGGAAAGGNSSGSSGGTSGGMSLSFPDGGFVFCTSPNGADGGGPVSWMCLPGTYLCDRSDPGNCFQCQSDADCANQSVPTYDPRRPRCDLQSGVSGYQSFCQQCVANSDCSGNPAGPWCDLSTVIPFGALEPSIALGGFEACTTVQTDCRLDGGPTCGAPDQECDLDGGSCTVRSFACSSDQECQGLVYAPLGYLLENHCVQGVCSACSSAACFPLVGGCYSDANCGNPSGSDAGLTCDPAVGACGCTSSAQCGGSWPVCEAMDGGEVNEFEEAIGFCGCDSSSQCGDGGLVCVPLSAPWAGLGYCGISCTAPGAPICGLASLGGLDPICDADNGLCVPCASDQQCASGELTGGDICQPDNGGTCGCNGGLDCPPGETCQGEGPFRFSVCAVALPQCDRSSCPADTFCDWDGGSCIGAPLCFQDFDCSPGAPFCDPQLRDCVECRNDTDCLNSGRAAQGTPLCCRPIDGCGAPRCTAGCRTDHDCTALPGQPACLNLDGGDPLSSMPFCGCRSDTDCAGHETGGHCDTDAGTIDFGYCGCQTAADCPAGQVCSFLPGDPVGACLEQCNADGDCAADDFCDSLRRCLPRCDPGHACSGTELICDADDQAGLNGQSFSGPSPGAVWCYQCLAGSDCPVGLACLGQFCLPCIGDGGCASDEVCSGNVCRARCDVTSCPAGEVCDTLGTASAGSDVCFECVTALDCPHGVGCNGVTHVCGTCVGPTADAGAFDCSPGEICSDYWEGVEPRCDPSGRCEPRALGVCLASCDRMSCPAAQPICTVIPSLTVDHRYCVACLGDSDCAALGAGAWCDVSVNRTFTCQPPPN
jgi:hypothetical protein